MTRAIRVVALLAFGAGLIADPAVAQSRRPPLRPAQPPPTPARPTFGASGGRGLRFMTFGGAFELPSHFNVGIQPLDFAERAAVDTRYSTKIVPGFDIGGGQTVWRRMAIAADLERVWKSGTADVAAHVPHPFFFNRLRPVAGQASSLQRAETALHFQAHWTTPLTPRVNLQVGGGPSVIWLRQDLVRDVTVAQTYPYDTAAFGGVVTQHETKGRLGVNAGVTLDYRLAHRLSAQVNVRYAHARMQFDATDTGTIGVSAGGTRVGAGLRIPF